ncbi:MAG: 3-deoxy-D-manno-octulosonic acid transferase [Planctomycetales bacterium]|nr:3-deoxy-D-manno-octulosonic acid transferase [Planctomycetales bacterium]
MPYLLNLIYLLLILLVSPWLIVQAVRKGKYREGYAAKFLGIVPQRTSIKKCLWLHAVSVGEVNLLAPLLTMIAEQRPEWDCVISTTTMTGMALARKKYPKNTVFYCPLDFSWAVKNAMRRVRPDVLVLAELELWPNLIRAAKRRGARVAVVNGRLGEKSFRGYRRIRPLVAGLMRKIDLVAAQDETYAERFRSLGARPEAVHVTGSMKYDGAQTDRNNAATRRLAELAGLADDDVVLLAGSTQEPEEEMALETFRALSPRWPRLRLVLVPRHPDRFDAVAKLLDNSGIPWQRRTALGCETASGGRVLLVDVVGELGVWWGTAQIAFVGGSMGSRGGQNMIEPAAYGAAVSFGPNTWNFRDVAAAMLEHDAAVVVRDGAEFTRFVRCCLERPDYAAKLGRRGQSLVISQLGATERTLGLLTALAGNC